MFKVIGELIYIGGIDRWVIWLKLGYLRCLLVWY